MKQEVIYVCGPLHTDKQYLAFIKKVLETKPRAQFAREIGASTLTIKRWLEGNKISYEKKFDLDAYMKYYEANQTMIPMEDL